MNFRYENQRALFPILRTRAQLSSCSQSAMSTPVSNAIANYMSSWLERGMDWGGWQTELDGAKAEFAQLIGASAQDIAVMSCVSDLSSSVGSALGFTPERNGIVLGEVDFPSLGHVWSAQEARGASVTIVSVDAEGRIPLESYERAIDERTLLVSISQVAYFDGFRQDVAAISALAHAKGALMFVDAYQSVGAMHIDVVRDEVDFLVCGAQKFLLGCPGIAFMYVRPSVAKRLVPANTGWFGRVDPFAFDIRSLDYAPGARRFDTGTPPYVNAAAARAGMALLNTLDMREVERYIEHLSDVAIGEALKQGLRIASPLSPQAKGSNTAIFVDDAAGAERKMAAKGYIVSARGAVIRIAPHFYNTPEEVSGAVAALAAC